MNKKKKRLKGVLSNSTKFSRISAAAVALANLKSKNALLSGGPSAAVPPASSSSIVNPTITEEAPLGSSQESPSTDQLACPTSGIEPISDLQSPQLETHTVNANTGNSQVAVESLHSGPVPPVEVSTLLFKAPTRKWSTVLSNTSLLEEIGEPTEHISGAPFVLIPDESIEDTKEEFKDFIFAQFHDKGPELGRIIGVVNALWARSGPRIFVHNIGKGTYLLRVQNPRTRAILLGRSIWNIAGHPMFVSPWSPEFNPEIPPITSAPVTVEFRGVPYLLFTNQNLSRIATAVGKPVSLAPETERKDSFEVARVVVRVDLTKELPTKVISGFSNGREVEIDVSYPFLPPRCSACRAYGHDLNQCSLRPLNTNTFRTSNTRSRSSDSR
ncbi:unnamed protein product [Arabis nemorensis]|uniref:DUF4283 domain-containing protein n=1 Tax=Arabis nemorensis TaxID=586526 RepID=A0A565BLX1_9BRAS|nr:unnamed protein product [Arabis nemorensis]